MQRTVRLLFKLVANVCEKRNGTCALYRNGYLTLVLSASSGNSAGQNLGTLAYALSESGYILVIDVIDLIGAEDANLLVLSAVYGRTGGSYGSSGGLCYGFLCNVRHYFVIHCIKHTIPRFLSKGSFSFHSIDEPTASSERKIVVV